MKTIKLVAMAIMVVVVAISSYGQDWNPGGASSTVDLSRSGNVSIGTTTTMGITPKLKVGVQAYHVAGSGPPSGLAGEFKLFNSSTNTTYALNVCSFQGYSGPFIFSAYKTVSGASTSVFTVNGDGLTTIGNVTTPTGYKLYVESGILTEKVKVAVKGTANWADYVFDKKYKLLSLSEVEAYIKKNKHLPGVPSAEEVVKEGIDMATMDAKLLEKIEELTLYVIELKKENEMLAKRVQVLEKK